MSELDPIAESEFVFRRIHPSFLDLSLPIAVQLRAFRPSQSDTAGLSVLRALFAVPEDLLTQIDPALVSKYAVARLAVRDLIALGLTVQPEPLADGPRGHAVIPELSWASYQGNKNHWKPVLLELAKFASADLVHRPS